VLLNIFIFATWQYNLLSVRNCFGGVRQCLSQRRVCVGEKIRRGKKMKHFFASQTMRLFGVSRLSKSIKTKRDFLINYMQAKVKNKTGFKSVSGLRL